MSQRTDSAAQGDKPHRPLPEWLAVRLDIPADLLSGGFRVDLRGRNSLTVHGVRSIGTYSRTCIVLVLREGSITVRGERLICSSYLAGAVGIDGLIHGILLDTAELTAEPTAEQTAELTAKQTSAQVTTPNAGQGNDREERS